MPSSLIVPGGRPEPTTPEPETPPEPAGPIQCVTAFVVYQLPDGLWQVADDLDAPLVPERKAHGDDFTAGCATTLRDVATRETVQGIINSGLGQAIVQSTTQSVIANMGLIGQQMAQAQESATVAQKLEKDKLRRGGR